MNENENENENGADTRFDGQNRADWERYFANLSQKSSCDEDASSNPDSCGVEGWERYFANLSQKSR